MALETGTRLGPYEILAPIGAGGMGEVYRARDPRLKRDVALKVLPEEVASDPERLERFEREAQTLASLNHPHIVTIHSVEEADDVRFLTMELVEGETLTRVIHRGGLPLPDFFRIAVPLAEAVSAAHEKGITHRDLKPGNVMVSDEGRLKILDFGLAKLRQGDEATEDSNAPTVPATDPGSVMGTAPYMSPEQVQGKGVDHRSDLFSLGVILYEMATGDRPFQGDTSAEVASSILRDTPPTVTEQKAELPRDLGKLVKRCLEKEPRKRFQSALDLANELDELRREVDSGEATISPAASHTGQPAGPVRGRSWIVGGAVLATLLLGIGYVLTRSPSKPSPTEAPSGEAKRLVVLPFENLGAPEDAYFAAGMTEEINSRLARVGGLRVISRTSAEQYERPGKTTRQIGEDFGVGYVLEGTVRWDRQAEGADRVRITPQLIRVADDTQLWADSYESVLDDIFEAQTEIAEAVVEQLDVTLLPEEQQRVETRPTESLEAYNQYLQGQFIRFQFSETEESLRAAADHFRRATEADPGFALAYAALAECHSILAALARVSGEDGEAIADQALALAEQALALDPALPDAHVALGQIREIHHYDWAGAEKAFTRAIELDPNHWNARREYGWLLRRMGRYAEAVEEHEAALDADPVSLFANSNLAASYELMGELDRAIEVRQRIIELYPERDTLHGPLAVLFAEKGLFERAFDELEQVAPSNRETHGYLSRAGYVHAIAGNTDEALKYIEMLEAAPESKTAYTKNHRITVIYAGLGDYDEVFQRLEAPEAEYWSAFLNAASWMAPVRNDPRYVALQRGAGLEPPIRRGE